MDNLTMLPFSGELKVVSQSPLPTPATGSVVSNMPSPAGCWGGSLELCQMLFSQDPKDKDIPINLPSDGVAPQEGDRKGFQDTQRLILLTRVFTSPAY